MRRSNLVLFMLSLLGTSAALADIPPERPRLEPTEDIYTGNKQTRDEKTDFRNLIIFIEKNGESGKTAEGFGHILGLSDERKPLKGLQSNNITNNGARDHREFAIIYKKENTPEDKFVSYIIRRKKFDGKMHSLSYLISLDGALEKAVVLDGKTDESGRPIPGSGTPVELDINSPSIRREFEAELLFWLNKAKNKP